MNSRGVVYVAYGEQAREQVRLSAKTLREQHPMLPFRVIADQPFGYAARMPQIRTIYHEDTDPGARLVKLNADLLSPFDCTLYLDADTRVQGDIAYPFTLLEAGWEMCICPTAYQGDEAHGHVNAEERRITFREVGVDAEVLQAGVMYFRKCDAVHRLFEVWREEWHRWEDQDQAALTRALAKVPVKLRTLNRDLYNSGQGRLIRHYCGFARRKGLKHSRANGV